MTSQKTIRALARGAYDRGRGVLVGVWTRTAENGGPEVLGRLAQNATAEDAGRASLIIETTMPPGVGWAVVPFGAFSREGPAPAVTEKTTWYATEEGLSPKHVTPIPPPQLEQWADSMKRVHTTDE
jgi:hypothetical protein